jgi:Fe-S-cluster containining protein
MYNPGELRSIYEEINLQTETFAQKAGLACKPGCGKCCEFPEISLTVTDCLVLAEALWESGKAEALHEKLLQEAASDNSEQTVSPCPIYQPSPVEKHMGRCSMWPVRPGLCRLFGFASMQSGQGRGLAACKIIKAQLEGRSEAEVSKDAPDITSWSRRIAATHPGLSAKPLPIRSALREALGIVITQKSWSVLAGG